MRITKNIKKEYENIKRATKRKVANTIKNQGALIHDIEQTKVDGKLVQNVVTYDIRSKLEIPSLESFKSKKEFDAWMYEQRKFTSGRSPHSKFSKNDRGVVMTDFLKMVLENKHHKAEKERLKEVKRLEAAGVAEVGRQQALMMKRPTMPEFNKIKLDFNALWNRGDLERKLIGLTIKGTKQDFAEKRRQLKENFVSALRQAFNSDVDDLVDVINKIPNDDFYVLYATNLRYFEIEEFYNETETRSRSLGKIYQIIGEYAEGKGELAAYLLTDF